MISHPNVFLQTGQPIPQPDYIPADCHNNHDQQGDGSGNRVRGDLK